MLTVTDVGAKLGKEDREIQESTHACIDIHMQLLCRIFNRSQILAAVPSTAVNLATLLLNTNTV